MCPQNILVIGGGVGPAAGVALHQKIIDITDNSGLLDQGHAPVIHLSMSPFVLDRTKYLLNNAEGLIPNPGVNMGICVSRACQAYSDYADRFIVGVPCNTFHSRAVFAKYSQIVRHPRIQLVNMIEETARYIRPILERRKKVILLSTRGTRDTRVYTECGELIECDEGRDLDNSNDKIQGHFFAGGRVIEGNVVSEENVRGNQQGAVMAAIYDPVHGVKGSLPNWANAKILFETVVSQLMHRAQIVRDDCCVIMGCTEIPLAYKEDVIREFAGCNAGAYVDPMDLLAQKMVTLAGYHLMSEERGVAAPPDDVIRRQNKQTAEEFTRSLSSKL